MYIKTIDRNTVDVFLNKGWESWVRLQRVGKGMKQIAGSVELTPQLEAVLKNKIRWH